MTFKRSQTDNEREDFERIVTSRVRQAAKVRALLKRPALPEEAALAIIKSWDQRKAWSVRLEEEVDLFCGRKDLTELSMSKALEALKRLGVPSLVTSALQTLPLTSTQLVSETKKALEGEDLAPYRPLLKELLKDERCSEALVFLVCRLLTARRSHENAELLVCIAACPQAPAHVLRMLCQINSSFIQSGLFGDTIHKVHKAVLLNPKAPYDVFWEVAIANFEQGMMEKIVGPITDAQWAKLTEMPSNTRLKDAMRALKRTLPATANSDWLIGVPAKGDSRPDRDVEQLRERLAVANQVMLAILGEKITKLDERERGILNDTVTEASASLELCEKLRNAGVFTSAARARKAAIMRAEKTIFRYEEVVNSLVDLLEVASSNEDANDALTEVNSKIMALTDIEKLEMNVASFSHLNNRFGLNSHFDAPRGQNSLISR